MGIRHGFTLIELLVSVFLTSIVVLAAYALVESSSNSLQNEIDFRVLEGNLDNAGQIIGRDLSRVGYHVPFDSRTDENGNMDANRILGSAVKNVNSIRSISYIGPQQVTGSEKRVAEFKLVIDMTDHYGFEVKSDNNSEMVLEKKSTSYLTLADVLSLPNTRPNPDHGQFFPAHVMDPAMSNAAFERAFRYAKAIYVKSSKKDERVLIMLKRLGGGGDADGVAASPANVPEGKIYYSKTEKATTNTTSLDMYGFDGTGGFIGERVSPIVSVVYRYNNGNLERCYSKSLLSEGTSDSLKSSSNLDACSTIVHNVAYFELYPITDVDSNGSVRGSFINYLNGAQCTSNHCGKTAEIGNLASFNNLQDEDVSKIIGFYYRLGAYTDRVVPGGKSDGVQPAVIRINGKDHSLAHTQGTVVLKNRTNLAGKPVKCVGNRCKLRYM